MARTRAAPTPSSSPPAAVARSTDCSAACSPWAGLARRPRVLDPAHLDPAHPDTATNTTRFKEARQIMKRLLWIIGLPIFLAACGAPGGLYGSAPAPTAASTAAPTPIAPASVIAAQNMRLGTILTNPQG